MSLERNRVGFEKALAEMQDTIALLDYCVDDDLISTLTAVVDEYDHYSSDIDSLIEDRDRLQEAAEE